MPWVAEGRVLLLCLPKLGGFACSEPRWVQTRGTLLGRVVQQGTAFEAAWPSAVCRLRRPGCREGRWVLSGGEPQGTVEVKNGLVGNLNMHNEQCKMAEKKLISIFPI